MILMAVGRYLFGIGNHTIAVVKGAEDYDTISTAFAATFQEIDGFQQLGFVAVNGVSYNIELFFSSDMKQQSTPPASPEEPQSTLPASPGEPQSTLPAFSGKPQSTLPVSPAWPQSIPSASPEEPQSTSSPQLTLTQPIAPQESTPEQNDFFTSPEDRILFCHFKNEIDRLKSELTAIVHGVRSSELHRIYWYGTKQEKAALRHGGDYKPITVLPEHVQGNLFTYMSTITKVYELRGYGFAFLYEVLFPEFLKLGKGMKSSSTDDDCGTNEQCAGDLVIVENEGEGARWQDSSQWETIYQVCSLISEDETSPYEMP
eukprot:Em0005g1431a